MHKLLLLGPRIRRFMLEHLIAEQNLSHNTQTSYRDTLVLLLQFIHSYYKELLERFLIEDVSPEVVRMFLANFESGRSCRVATRNQRIAAIHSLAKFIGLPSPEHLAWGTDLRAIPFKKAAESTVGYLEKPERDALLQFFNRKTLIGYSNHSLLLFLYHTGARADEAAHEHVAGFALERSPSVRIHGRVDKTRVCPLWPHTADVLKRLVTKCVNDDYVFRNARRSPLNRFGIYRLDRKAGVSVSFSDRSLRSRGISPHTVRHTTAVQLLRAAVDINTIRAWLGHVSIDTINIYVEVNLVMKAKALAHSEIEAEKRSRPWLSDSTLMAFLKAP